jgi:hypothetical protein
VHYLHHLTLHVIVLFHMPSTPHPGAMSFEDGLKLVKLRGESMQAAADAVRSGMVSVIGLDKEKVAALCEAATEEVRGGNVPALFLLVRVWRWAWLDACPCPVCMCAVEC